MRFVPSPLQGLNPKEHLCCMEINVLRKTRDSRNRAFERLPSSLHADGTQVCLSLTQSTKAAPPARNAMNGLKRKMALRGSVISFCPEYFFQTPVLFMVPLNCGWRGNTEVNAVRTKPSKRTKRLQCHSLHGNGKTDGPSVTGLG